MEEKLEKSIEGKVGKTLGDKIKKDVEKEVRKEVKKEVEKRFPEKIYEKTKKSALNFRKEFKRQTVVAITAAFGFLLALSWRTPIESSLNNFLDSLGLIGKDVYIQYVSAMVITIVGVLVLMWISKWNAEK